MREIEIAFDDERPGCCVCLDTMATPDPFSWDASVRERTLAAAPGYPEPSAVRLATRQLLRTDALEEEGVRLDLTWFNGAVAASTERAGSHVPGVTVHRAREEAGRSLVLVGPADVGRVAEVRVDGVAVLARRFGFLCDLARERRAQERYAGLETARLRDELLPGGYRGEASPLQALCLLHELVRRGRPEWRGEELGRPVWDERRIAWEHGMPEGAWWRTATLAAADGEFYTQLGADEVRALVWGPAVAWYRMTCGGEAQPADAARWFGLPEVDAEGNDTCVLLKDAWG